MEWNGVEWSGVEWRGGGGGGGGGGGEGECTLGYNEDTDKGLTLMSFTECWGLYSNSSSLLSITMLLLPLPLLLLIQISLKKLLLVTLLALLPPLLISEESIRAIPTIFQGNSCLDFEYVVLYVVVI